MMSNSTARNIKYFEQLVEMVVFKNLPRAKDVQHALETHVAQLGQQATCALSLAKEGRDMLGWIMKLKNFTNAFPSNADAARALQKDLLAGTKAKLKFTGMKNLASALREAGGGLGNEVVNDAEAFRAITIEEFNNKTYQDPNALRERLRLLNPEMSEPDFANLTKQVEAFQTQNELDIRFCIRAMDDTRMSMKQLVVEAKKRVQICKEKPLYTPVDGIVSRVQSGMEAAAQAVNKMIGGGATDALKQPELPTVVAAIFAWWTMEFYAETRCEDEAFDMVRVRKAHEMQITCILRMLGIVRSNRIVSHLAEVFTGQGKSVILAVLAVTLALFGFSVDVVCYSKALSERDRDEFNSMFDAFGVGGKIRYGTFEQLSDKLIHEKHGDVRQMVLEYLTKNKTPQLSCVRQAQSQRILLIDEVDVFLSPELFSGTYRPSCRFGGPEILELLKLIWKSPQGSLDHFKAMRAYRVVLERSVVAPAHEWFLESAVCQMKRAVSDFKTTPPQRGVDYVVASDGWVMYKLQDRTCRSDEMSYGYATNCIYLHEYEEGRINDEQLQQRGLLLHAICGEFSYALLPRTKCMHPSVSPFYQSVLGATGTLAEERLPEQERKLLKHEIGIERFTFCATMYRENTLSFDYASKDDVQMLSDWDHQACAIAEEIKRRLKPTSAQYKGERAVIAVFESIQEMDRFCSSSYASFLKDVSSSSGYKSFVDRLTEVSARELTERKAIIERATRPGHVTLATRSFGRGVDFKVLDDHLLVCGGMHVLLTFFPSDKSEEVQIKGRTARQGDAGSFSMVMRVDQLVDFCNGLGNVYLQSCVNLTSVTNDVLQTWNSQKGLYKQLEKIRDAAAKKGLEARLKLSKEAIKVHGETADAFQDQEALRTLLRRNNAIGGGSVTRTLMLIDLTYSMSDTLEATKARVRDFFERCQAVLDKEGIDQGFELQIAGYSNYNVDIERILEASAWEAKPANLQTFLSNLDLRGGMGNEAIEVGLMHALSEHKADRPITQIVLIGDAPPNTEHEIGTKRAKIFPFSLTGSRPIQGAQYWERARSRWAPNGVPKMTASQAIAKMKPVVGRPPPIFAYYLNDYAKVAFQKLARESGGTAHSLPIHDPKGAEMLTDAVCTKILKGIGGDRLEKAYERMKASFG